HVAKVADEMDDAGHIRVGKFNAASSAVVVSHRLKNNELVFHHKRLRYTPPVSSLKSCVNKSVTVCASKRQLLVSVRIEATCHHYWWVGDLRADRDNDPWQVGVAVTFDVACARMRRSVWVRVIVGQQFEPALAYIPVRREQLLDVVAIETGREIALVAHRVAHGGRLTAPGQYS